jgi:hypothetical protein
MHMRAAALRLSSPLWWAAGGVLVLAAMLLFAPDAWAQATGGGGSGSQSLCSQYQGLINRFGSCIKQTIIDAGVGYFDTFYQYFLTAINAFLTFGVIIYGVMIAAGMVENIKRDSMVVLLKIAFVVFFCQNLEMIYFWVLDMMDGLIEIFFQFTTSLDQGKCQNGGGGSSGSGGGGQGFAPFQRMDCLLDLVVGLKSGTYNGSYTDKMAGEGVGRGLINFFFKGIVSNSLGALIGAVGMAIVYTIITTIIKITFMYLLAVLAITFMMFLGPIFIPLVIFKVTKVYFDKWVNLVVSFGLQPVLMFAYVACMIIAFDKAIFSDQNSLVGAITGGQAQQSNFSLNDWLANGKTSKTSSLGEGDVRLGNSMDQDPVKQGKQVTNPNFLAGMITSDIKNTSGGGGGGSGSSTTEKKSDMTSYGLGVPIEHIDWKKLCQASGKQESECMKSIVTAVAFAALVVYCFSAMLYHIPHVVTDLAGGIYDSPNLFGMVQDNPVNQLGGAAKQKFNALIGGRGGGA